MRQIALLLLLCAGGAVCAADAPAVPKPGMSVNGKALAPLVVAKDQLALLSSADAKLARNKKLVFDFWRIVYEGGHMERAPEFMAPEYIQHNPNVESGRDAFMRTIGASRKPREVKPTSAFPIINIVAERDIVMVMWARKVRDRAADNAEERLLDVLLPPAREVDFSNLKPTDSATRQKFRKMLREGALDDREVEIEVAALPQQMEIMAPPGMEDLTSQIQGMFQQMGGGRRKQKKMTVVEAMKVLTDEEAARLLNDDEIKAKALAAAEQNGIVFLDEMDKIASRSDAHGADVSRQGVQRDLLPIVEGTTVATKYGMVKTDHILFIASGAFHLSKPSDLIPELQGRFPIRVELLPLSVSDFEKILTATDACLTRQYAALLATEQVHLEFQPDGIRRLAEIAFAVNEKTENIGARRLYTVMEKLLEEVAFDAGSHGGAALTIDAAYVDGRLKDLAQSEDLARYVL